MVASFKNRIGWRHRGLGFFGMSQGGYHPQLDPVLVINFTPLKYFKSPHQILANFASLLSSMQTSLSCYPFGSALPSLKSFASIFSKPPRLLKYQCCKYPSCLISEIQTFGLSKNQVSLYQNSPLHSFPEIK